MKKLNLMMVAIAMLIATMFMLGVQNLKAQTTSINKGDILFNGEFSFPNVAQTLYNGIGDGTNNGGSSPYSLELGYAITDRNVIGLYWNSSSASTGNIAWGDSTLSPSSGSYYYSISLNTYGLSYYHYLPKSYKFAPYYGAMIGYTDVSEQTHGIVPSTDEILTVKGSYFAYQLYFGATYYFILDVVGIDAKVSLGTSYYASIGIATRFGKN